MKGLRALTIILAVTAAVFSVKATSQDREVSLRFKFPANQVRTYEQQVSGEMAMTMQILGQGMPVMVNIKGKMTQTERVEDVDKDGVATLTIVAKGRIRSEATGLPAGAELPPEQDIPPIQSRIKVNPLGKVLEVQVKLPEEGKRSPTPSPFGSDFLAMPQMRGFTWQNLLLPENPVRVGDTWDITTKVDFRLEDRTVEVEVKGKARLVAFEKLDGRDCAVIEVTTEIPDLSELMRALPTPEEKAKVSATTEGQSVGKIWFDIVEGLVVKSEMSTDMTANFTITLQGGQGFSMSMQGNFRVEQRLTKIEQVKSEGK